MKGIALYPGAYKPPTRGHFLVVKSLLNNSFNAVDVDRESGAASGVKEKPEVTGVKVFIGTQVRNGITQQISKQIWDIYKKYLKGNLEVIASDRNPVADVYSLLKHNPETPFLPVVGYRDASDMADLKRFDDAKNRYPNMTILTITSSGDDATRATDLRKAILDGDDKEAAKYLPQELSAKDLETVINLLKSTVTIEERMEYNMEQVMLGMLTEEKEVEEVTMGLPVAPMAVLPSEVTQYMRDLTAKLKPVLPEDVTIEYNGQAITITPKYYNKPNAEDNTPEQDPINEYEDHIAAINYVPYIAGILEHMVRKGMKVLPLPEIKTREDQENAANVFGRTAYYDPTKKEVVLYVTGRHPKDVLRSFCHEMIHHMQNLEGRLPAFTTANTQEDSALNEIEKEAHYLGSMTMREWEDSVKKEQAVNEWLDQDDKILTEVVNPEGEKFKYVESKTTKGLYTYKDSVGNLFFARVTYQPAQTPFFEFKVGWFRDNKTDAPVYDPALPDNSTGVDNLKRRNTVAAIYVKEVVPFFLNQNLSNTLKINPISAKRYSFSKRMVDKLTSKDLEVSEKENTITISKQQHLDEGTKYRSIVADVRQAVNIALKTLLDGKKLKGYNLKTKREPSEKDREFAEKYGMSPLGAMLYNEYQTAYLGTFESKSEKGTPTTVGVSLKFALTDEVEPGKFHIDGEAGSDEGEIDIILAFNPADGTNMLQQIQPTLTDLIRHETEHLTQSGDQVKPTKWMKKDEARRRAIRQNPEIWHKYYMLPKEVDANIQGLYTKSKYEKKDFQTTIDSYLDDLVDTGIITVGNRQKIYDLWKQRIPQIGGIPNLK